MELSKRLLVQEEGRYLQWSTGEAFYCIADTAWEMLHKGSFPDIQRYLDIRKEQGFNTILMVALAELDGMEARNPQGHVPTQEEYWKDLDQILAAAGERGMVIALLPTWGDKWNRQQGVGPEFFNPENAYQYGEWIGKRYRDTWNLFWVLGGDRPIQTREQERTIDAMADGLKQGDQGQHLITFHPCGAASSVDFVKNKSYIDFHSIQSGHGLECYDSAEMLRRTWQEEHKPVFDMECRYEDFPACFRVDLDGWTDADVRNNLYWNLMQGAMGAAYGHRDVWRLASGTEQGEGVSDLPGEAWQTMLRRPAAEQIRYLARLRMMRPYYELRPAPELIGRDEDRLPGQGCIAAARGEKYAYFYTGLGLPVHAELRSLGCSCVRCTWYSPRDVKSIEGGIVRADQRVFAAPSSGRGNDWVLILDNMDQ